MVIIKRAFLFKKENKREADLPLVVILHQDIQYRFIIKQKANPVQMFTGTALSCLTATTTDMYVYTLFHLIFNVALVIPIYSTNKSIDTSSIHNIWSDIQATLKTFNTF